MESSSSSSKGLRFATHQSIFSMVGSGDLDGLKQLATVDNESSSSISDMMSLQSDHGETALYIAANNNLKDVFTFLVEFCSFEVVKIRSNSDMNAFHVAAKRGHLGIYSNSFRSSFILPIIEENICINCSTRTTFIL